MTNQLEGKCTESLLKIHCFWVDFIVLWMSYLLLFEQDKLVLHHFIFLPNLCFLQSIVAPKARTLLLVMQSQFSFFIWKYFYLLTLETSLTVSLNSKIQLNICALLEKIIVFAKPTFWTASSLTTLQIKHFYSSKVKFLLN
jgi:hypothetical protein